MAFLFPRNRQRVIADLVRNSKELLQKLSTVEQLPQTVSVVVQA
jgi:hypothetical protein